MANVVSDTEDDPPPLRFSFRHVPEREYEDVSIALDETVRGYTNQNRLVGIPPWKDIKHHFISEESTRNWLLEEKILNPPTHCPQCHVCLGPCDKKGMLRCYNCKRIDGHEWTQSVYKGTFFEGFKGGRDVLMQFLYNWLVGCTNGFHRKTLGWSNNKTQNWIKAVQDMIAVCVLSQNRKIGGEGIVVQIDETKIGKRKYHRGHRVEGAWVFGGVECTPDRKCFAVIVEKRDKATLLPLIREFIEPGSIIMSDCWKAYDDISRQEGYNYTHERVNHSETYVNRDNGACTNDIEGTWCAMKRMMPVRQRTRKHIQNCIFEFIWRRNNHGNLWNGLLASLRDVYYED